MELYCRKCGERLKDGAAFCSRCGAPVPGGGPGTRERADWERMHYEGAETARYRAEEYKAAGQWAAASSLSKISLAAAKGTAVFLMGAAALVCGLASAGLLVVSGYMLYCFASGSPILLPWLLTGGLTGASVLMGGIMAAFTAILSAAAAVSLARCIHVCMHLSPRTGKEASDGRVSA